MVKLEDIARKLNLSLTTVSRALNGYDDVSPATRSRVQKAARSMKYVVNRSARSLALRRSHLVSLLIYDDDRMVRPYQSITFEVIAGVRDFLGTTTYDMIIIPERFRARNRETLRSLCASRGVDGIFVMGIRTDDPYLEELKTGFIPTVFLDVPIQGRRTTFVESDNTKGCRLAVDHLAAQGHRHIAFINGHRQAAISAVRLEGYRSAMEANGLGVERSLVIASSYTEKSGYDATRRLLREKRDFSAIFAASDLMALGSTRALREAGRAVPGDVAVVGFDDILLAEYSHPRLTTIRQHMFQMGREGAEELYRIMEQPGHVPARRTVDVELVIRESA